jgi:alanine-glyoxylate transaminase/serine-glyoxylate transaminase/serine-pyruvate transaminase
MPRTKYTINMSCGQTDIYPQALVEMGKQLHNPIYYLPYFELETACTQRLKTLLHTQHDVLTLVGTATYGEEAAFLCALEPGEHCLTVNTGVFGQVLTDLARVVGAVPTEIKTPVGESVTPAQIRAALKQDPSIKLVAVVHVETSRGTLNPIQEIGAMLAQEFPQVLYLVDSVSGLAAADLRLDDWHIDLCCTSGQKAVNAPQGTAIVGVSPKAWQVMESRKTPIYGLCLDLLYWRRYQNGANEAIKHWDDDGSGVDASFQQYKSVHGPSQSYVLIKGLNAALEEILAEGLENVLHRHQVTAHALREGVRAMGLSTLASEANAAPDATCVLLPGESFPVKTFMRRMWDEYGIATAGGSPSKEQQEYVGFRVGTMGLVAGPQAVFALLGALEQLLPSMGYTIKTGAALSAAQAVFAIG